MGGLIGFGRWDGQHDGLSGSLTKGGGLEDRAARQAARRYALGCCRNSIFGVIQIGLMLGPNVALQVDVVGKSCRTLAAVEGLNS